MARLRLSAAARADIVALLAWSAERFGDRARDRYETLLATALADLANDPMRLGSAARPELGDSIRSYHLRHSRARAAGGEGPVGRPRHLVLYRLDGAGIVEVGRVLHDAMELDRHMPSARDDEDWPED